MGNLYLFSPIMSVLVVKPQTAMTDNVAGWILSGNSRLIVSREPSGVVRWSWANRLKLYLLSRSNSIRFQRHPAEYSVAYCVLFFSATKCWFKTNVANIISTEILLCASLTSFIYNDNRTKVHNEIKGTLLCSVDLSCSCSWLILAYF